MRRRLDDSGQALVEFALVLPLLALLLLGIVEFARAWQAYQVITDTAREGVRTVVSDEGLTQAEFDQIMTGALTRSGLGTAGATWQASGCKQAWCTAPGLRGEPAVVELEYDFSFPLLGQLLGMPPVTLATDATMRNE